MARNKITIVKGQNGLSRVADGEDYISGLVFYSSTLPSGFSTTSRIKLTTNLADAEALGITNDHTGETKATGTVTITAIGANDDTISIKVVEPKETVTLATYTKTATETTVTLIAAAIVSLINAGDHGYTATNTAGAITITAREGLGVFLNSGTPLATSITGTITATLSQFSGGVASVFDIMHYHISEFYRINPTGLLYVGIFAIPSTFDGAEIQTLVNYSNGKIRQKGVYYTNVAFATSQVQALQGVEETLEGLYKWGSTLYAPDIIGTTNLLTVSNLSSLDSNKVSVVIGQDGYGINDSNEIISGLGYELFKATGKSITSLGATLGAVSKASVEENIAWIQNFNMSDGTELEYPAISNGQNVSSLADSTLDFLDSYRYVFLTKQGIAGTYFNDSHTAITKTSDYAYIENNRTIDKACRGVYQALLPLLNSPLVVNTDGTLKNTTIATFESPANSYLAQMCRDGEISGEPGDLRTYINPAQNVLTSSILEMTITIQPVGVARNIKVNIGFAVKL